MNKMNVEIEEEDSLPKDYENGCPWNSNICSHAVRNGHLGCLKYAHENECPWDNSTFSIFVG
jgi:hypothetical protein